MICSTSSVRLVAVSETCPSPRPIAPSTVIRQLVGDGRIPFRVQSTIAAQVLNKATIY